jgi:hypothetical protein
MVVEGKLMVADGIIDNRRGRNGFVTNYSNGCDGKINKLLLIDMLGGNHSLLLRIHDFIAGISIQERDLSISVGELLTCTRKNTISKG